ncbi:hypothetical protein [Paenibacillus riograndensis]|uniref:PPM-type phosphatase domain-containing protein n=1 Tax=Paenibacillus riograndensis SBR5 TaxID=1073571 RepID=A0A0E4CYT8_9BACL|nr:hypothetical protein [Paenibacillus riograndensis]CQR57795.1 hypothetical protein PRIO_5406 [Paenibacillus riograndensis SBR5]
MPEVPYSKIDTYSLQGDGEWNKDALVIHDAASVYGVIDGASSLSAYRNKTCVVLLLE